jgi:exopolysaccharide biosynthesis WecB/TagA/CpsF family protein
VCSTKTDAKPRVAVGGTTEAWPPKCNIVGVKVSAAAYDRALDNVMQAARSGRSACVSHLAVHGVITASRDPVFARMLEHFEIAGPDGMPVRMALNLLHKARLPSRFYGPEFMLRVCERAASEQLGVYLYGSHPHVVNQLRDNLVQRFPALRVVGCEPSVFRPLSESEDDALVERINNSGARIVFVGLGCPLQEKFAYAHRTRLRAVQICVGAAFDFHAGEKRMAPRWMQALSLEWLFRLMHEPKRLWQRYLVTNSIFVGKVLLQLAGLRYRCGNGRPTTGGTRPS